MSSADPSCCVLTVLKSKILCRTLQGILIADGALVFVGEDSQTIVAASAHHVGLQIGRGLGERGIVGDFFAVRQLGRTSATIAAATSTVSVWVQAPLYMRSTIRRACATDQSR